MAVVCGSLFVLHTPAKPSSRNGLSQRKRVVPHCSNCIPTLEIRCLKLSDKNEALSSWQFGLARKRIFHPHLGYASVQENGSMFARSIAKPVRHIHRKEQVGTEPAGLAGYMSESPGCNIIQSKTDKSSQSSISMCRLISK